MIRRKKYLANEMRAPILMRNVIDGDTRFHSLGRGGAFSYLLDINFERLAARDTTECILGMIFVTWCFVKLDCYVTFCSSCLILIVANDIIHMKK